MRKTTILTTTGGMAAALSCGLLAGPAHAEPAAVPGGSAARIAAEAPAAADAARGWRCHTVTSTVTGARVTAKICWSRTRVRATGVTYDTKDDRKAAGVRIRVQRPRQMVPQRYIGWVDGKGRKKSWSDTDKGSGYWIKACVKDKRATTCARTWS
ncbi:hypothetical protein AGRA3207_002667 [Actinomadura graeca]|uniref:Secreted protein n=1 Tax=Actinomadura graeca TaxID=2750812 RepID=A0ABX8QSI8_9ACTN|nr:hypothetical protein [Actinomadura graeca]QXJ21779.1 hypothetical protein AGRA3207_002667 [Actinomadura graeca]